MIRLIPIIALLFLSSCAAVSHLDEALTLKGYSDEKDAQTVHIQVQDRKFLDLAVMAKAGSSFQEYQKKPDFIARFGDPVLVEKIQSSGGQSQERLLYRRATDYFSGEKVYVFFDEAGRLDRVSHER